MAGAYGNFEVITYGAGTEFVNAFQSVALLAGADVTASLLRVVLLTGLLMGIFRAVADFRGQQLLKWVLMVVMIQGVFWIPKVTVHVTDRWNPGLVSGDVANVPLALGLVASVATEVEDYAITSTQTMFGDPQSLAYTSTGMVYGPRLFSGLAGMQISDPVLSQNMGQFLADCVIDDLLQGTTSMDRVMNSPDTWGDLTANLNPSLMTRYADYASDRSTTTSSLIACQSARDKITTQLGAEITQQQGLALASLFAWSRPAPGGAAAPATPLPAISTSVSDFSARALGTSITTAQLYSQALVASSLSQATHEFAGKSGGDNAITSLATLQGETQARASAQMSGTTARRMVQVMQILLELLLISVFPILFPAFLLPSLGPRLITSYFSSFVFLQLWGPLLVVLNEIFMAYGASALTGVAYLPAGMSYYGGQYAVTYRNLAAVARVSQDVSDLAGWAMMSVPLIAGLLTRGLAAAGEGVQALAGATASGATLAATTAATGNVSRDSVSLDNLNLGNTSLWNQSGFNATQDQINTSPNIVRFGARGDTADGLSLQYVGATSQVLRSVPTASLLAGASFHETLSSQFQQRGAETTSLAHSAQDAWTKGEGVATQAIQAWGRGAKLEANRADNQGADARTHFATTFSRLDQITAGLQSLSGMSVDEARSVTVGFAANGGLSVSNGLFAGAAQAKVSGDFSKRWSKLSSEQRSYLESQGDALNRAFTEDNSRFATKLLQTSAGANAFDTFTQQQTRSRNHDYRQTVEDLYRTGHDYSEEASRLHSGGASAAMKYDNLLNDRMAAYYTDPKTDWGVAGRPSMGDFFSARGEHAMVWAAKQREIAANLAREVSQTFAPEHRAEDYSSVPSSYPVKLTEIEPGSPGARARRSNTINSPALRAAKGTDPSSPRHRSGSHPSLKQNMDQALELVPSASSNSQEVIALGGDPFLGPMPGGESVAGLKGQAQGLKNAGDRASTAGHQSREAGKAAESAIDPNPADSKPQRSKGLPGKGGGKL